MNVETRGVLKQFLSIKGHAANLLNLITDYDHREDETNSVRREYEDARSSFAAIVRKEKVNSSLREVRTASYWSSENKAALREIIIECEKAVEILGNMIITLSKEEMDRLELLRSELKTLSTELEDMNYERNMTKAIDEYEVGHTLASALISSRVIIYALNKIPGKEAEDKVKFLDEKKIIDKKGKDPSEFILKANKKARNFFSHDIKAFPDSSDAISLLGDTVGILRVIMKLEEASKNQNRRK